MSEDYEDLLHGLGSDDLNDFDFDLRDDVREESQARRQPGEDEFGEDDDFFNGE
jgi:hypothetical protein